MEDLIYFLSYDRTGFMGMDAAMAYLAELLTDRDLLFVVNDV